jgi:uncharacterized membrane protein
MGIEPRSLLTILGMGLVTYATRASGLWLMGYVSTTPRVEAWLRHIPGAILVAIVAPAVLASGLAQALAALATMVVMARTHNLVLAMAVGVAAVWALRLLL